MVSAEGFSALGTWQGSIRLLGGERHGGFAQDPASRVSVLLALPSCSTLGY